MSSYISEQDVENMALDTLKAQGYKVYKSDSYTDPNSEIDFERNNDHSKSILTGRLLNALKIINPGYEEEIYKMAMRQFINLADNPDMMINNHYLHRLIIDGAKVKTTINGENRTFTLYPIDFKDISNNDFIATNQFTIQQGDHERRPDVSLFINGLPLVTFEFKDATNAHIGIEDAFKQFNTYKSEISDYMQYNEILIISDAISARAGSLTAGLDRFMRWRAPKNKVSNNSDMELETLIKYMLNPKDLLNIIENFIIFETNADKTVKILTAYHQYYMVNKAITVADKVVHDPKDKRIGVVWHTTGSGKSLSMVFFSGIAARKLNNPTILVINDRNDLDDQLFGTFSAAHEFLQQNPEHAESREDVRNYMSKNSGGIVFSTIQKFAPDNDEKNMPVLTNRSDVIVIADEAHRSQYGLEAKYNTESGTRYGYAKYLRDALPNASFMGFTGTPINIDDKSTTAVFGNYIDVYDITQAVNDHATVKIYYESHVFPLSVKKDMQEKYNQMLRDYDLNDNVDDSSLEKKNKEYSRLEALAGTKPRLEQVAKHFVQHFESRQKEQFGKSMIVEMSRNNAVKLYNEIIAIRPEWGSDDLNKGKIKIIMTSNASDGPEMSKHHTNKTDRAKLQKRMKDNSDELQIVIVVDMWLTGFDAPSMNTMYIDKPMHGHNLIQAIARVNRVFKDKDSGLIVDYIGIADSLKAALNHYSHEDKGQVGINMDKAMSLLQEKYNIIKEDFLYGIDYTGFDSDNRTVRIKTVNRVANELLGEDDETIQKFFDVVTELQKAYALVSTQPEAQELGPEIAFFKTVKVFITKIKSNDDPEDDSDGNKKIDYRMRQLLDQSIIAEPNVDIYKDLGLERPNLDLISDKFLDQVGHMDEQNTAVALLTKLLKGKVRSLKRVNMVQSRKFKEMLEDSIQKYNNRGITSELVIRNLIEMAKKINAEQEKGKDLGLSPEEVAFYDALADHEKAVEMLGEKKLQQIAGKLVEIVREEAGIDWQRRKNVQAKMRIAVRKLLREYGYPPDMEKSAISTVVEQAEKMAINEE